MKNATRNLLLAACVLFAASLDSCTTGVEYDRRHKLSPEYDGFTCTMEKTYGGRWERLGLFTFTLGATLCFAAFAIRRRKKQSQDLRRSIITEEE